MEKGYRSMSTFRRVGLGWKGVEILVVWGVVEGFGEEIV